MAVLSIETLLVKFGVGKSPRSQDYIDLIDTLADDRNAVYFSETAPADTAANPLWFDTSTNVLSVYSNEAWSNIDLSLKAPLASPTLTGTPTAPTATAGTNTTQVATTEFVGTAVSNLVDAAPAALDTLNELAAALGDDVNFATTVTTSLSDKASLTSANTFTGGVQQITTASTATVGLIVKGAASQTANLQQWQNSAGTVLAKVDSAGYIWSPDQDVASQTSWTGAVTLSQTDSLKTYIKKQLTGNTTVTVSDGVAGKTYSCTLELQQDATGSRSIILKGCRTADGVALVLTTTASATDIVRLEWNGTYWTAFMGAAQISVPSTWV